jgi:hypothetical protein
MKKRWVFVCSCRGTYINAEDPKKEHIGPSLYLGVESGENQNEAFGKLQGKQGLTISLPDINKAHIWGYEIVGEGIDVKLNKAVSSDNEEEEDEDEVKEKPAKAKRGPGSPPKAPAVETAPEPAPVIPTKRGRGRPKKNTTVETKITSAPVAVVGNLAEPKRKSSSVLASF